jgi:hypothetical protein
MTPRFEKRHLTNLSVVLLRPEQGRIRVSKSQANPSDPFRQGAQWAQDPPLVMVGNHFSPKAYFIATILLNLLCDQPDRFAGQPGKHRVHILIAQQT